MIAALGRFRSPRRSASRFGFTLIELLVVIAIIAILATIGIVSFQSASRSSRNAKRQADIEQVRQALVLHRVDNGTYPTLSDIGESPGGSATQYYLSLIVYLEGQNYLQDDSTNRLVDPTNVDPLVYKYNVFDAGQQFWLRYRLEPDNELVEVTNP